MTDFILSHPLAAAVIVVILSFVITLWIDLGVGGGSKTGGTGP